MEKQRVPLEAAELLAQGMMVILAPHAERMEVAGSVRRRLRDVGDVELLYIPKWLEETVNTQLFGNSGNREDAVDVRIRRAMADGILEKRLNTLDRPIGYGTDNKFLVHRPSGIALDLFSTTACNWGMAMVVRTGPAEWNVGMMKAFRRLGMQGHAYGGVDDAAGHTIDCPTEDDVFRLLGIEYIDPEGRSPGRLVNVGKG